MSEPSIHDQWKANGDCAMCRRKNYCKTACSAAKRRHERIIREAFARSHAGRMMSATKKTMQESGHEMEYLDG